jgi:hypothetical protein
LPPLTYVFFNVLSVANSNQLRTLPDELRNNFSGPALQNAIKKIAETMVNKESPSLRVILPLKERLLALVRDLFIF